jgi:hypothetical protein
VSDGLPEEIWSYVFRPPPAWSWSIEPDFEPNGPTTPLIERDFPAAARAAFAFLEGLGFVLTAADAWDMTDDALTIGWERTDALVMATLADDGSFFVLFGPRSDDDNNTPMRARLMAWTADPGAVASFGSLPVLSGSRDAMAETVAGYVRILHDRVAPLLADPPVDFEKLTLATGAAVDEISRPRLVAYYRERTEAAWNDRRYETFLEGAEQLEALGFGLDGERLEVAKARRRPPLTLGGDQLGEAARIRRAAQLVDEKHSRLNKAADERDQDREAWTRWEDAAREWHEAMALLYPKEFWDGIERLRRGDAAAIEPAITFLEVDPWCFRSGYAKETILRFLKRADLSVEQSARLRAVILAAVDVGDRREFRGHSKLARHVVDDGLRMALLERLRSSDPGRARRALWILDALREPLGPDDRLSAQAVLEAEAAGSEWWRVSAWVRPYVGRYGDIEWTDRLLARAVGGGPESGKALRLLSALPVAPSEEQRRVLAFLVVREIRHGEDEGWLESTAVLADSPAFRDELIEAYNGASTSDEQRRAWWAINAIRRSVRDGWPGDAFTR